MSTKLTIKECVKKILKGMNTKDKLTSREVEKISGLAREICKDARDILEVVRVGHQK